MHDSGDFFLFKILRAHILPLTNCAFNKSGDKFITGSYDRTCKVWNTMAGDELLTLEGHRYFLFTFHGRLSGQTFDLHIQLMTPETWCMLLLSTTRMVTRSSPALSTKPANFGMQKPDNCITPIGKLGRVCNDVLFLLSEVTHCPDSVIRTGATPQRLCVYPSTHTERCSRQDPWTTPHGKTCRSLLQSIPF